MGSALSLMLGDGGNWTVYLTIDCPLYFLYFYWFSYLGCSYAAPGMSVRDSGGERGDTVTMHSYRRSIVKLSIFIALLTDISDSSSPCRTCSSLTA